MTERRRPLDTDDGQGSLFGGEAFAPARPAAPWARPASEPPAPEFEASLDGPPALGEAGTGATFGHAGAPTEGQGADQLGRDRADLDRDRHRARHAGLQHGSAPVADEIDALERAAVAVDAVRSPRSPLAPLAGPTLDDVMSRAWEGLATGLPAACPVCTGEVVPALTGPPHGRCSSCGTTID